MNSDIQIVEKPDWVSWEDIKQCLVEAHAVNRAKGINMAHYQWPVEKIREYIGTNGVMLVALDGEKVVGTAAIIEKKGSTWYAKGLYANMGFAGVLPAYNGRGIYRNLTQKREEIARSRGYTVLVLDTHEKNKKLQSIAKTNGYRLAGYFRTMNKDHFNVVMVKWLDNCPNSKFYCRLRFFLTYFRVHCSALIRH